MKLSEKPAPIPVYMQGETDPCGYACGVCRNLFAGATRGQEIAHTCCPPNKCERSGCNEPRMTIYAFCLEHVETEHRAGLVSKMRNGKIVPAASWTGPVWHEPADERGWHATVSEFVDWEKGCDRDPPSWVWGCEVRTLGLDADDIITNATENACCGEGAEEAAYAGEQDLQVALDAWCKSHPVTWWEPTDTVVVIDPKRFAEEFGQPSEPKEGA